MRDAMSPDQIQKVISALRDLGSYAEVQKAFPGWEPSFWEVNKKSFHRLAGVDLPAEPDPKAKR